MKSRIQLVLGIAVVAAIVAIGVLLWVDRMRPVTILLETPASQTIEVSVTGAVASPGVVEVPAGARLLEVVDAAGGFSDEAATDGLNLAARIGDGEQVEIPSVGEPTPVQPAPRQDGLIDLNTATVAELDELPGIGDVLAGRIVEYRQTVGPFTSVDQLSEIDGISPRLVDEIRPFVTVGPGG